jgi:hypothetical protein
MKQKTTFIQAVFPSHQGGASLFLAYRSSDLPGCGEETKTAGREIGSTNALKTRVRSISAGLRRQWVRLRTPRIRTRALQAG